MFDWRGLATSTAKPFSIHLMTKADKEFGLALRAELERRRTPVHAANKENPEQIVYREHDVLELLSMAIVFRPSIVKEIRGFRPGN